MARIEFSANPTHLSKHPHQRQPPTSGRDETRNSVDYISELPDAIILHVFSFLDTKDAMKTSILSKRWRSTWAANPHISFSMPYCGDNSQRLVNFIAFVDAVLSRCTAIKVKSFLFDNRFNFSFWESRIERWLHFAVGHGVEEVSVILPKDEIYVLPRFFFRCTTLVSLHMSCCRFSKIRVVNWSSLKRLRIMDAELEDIAMMRVLSGCPVLEFFELKDCWGLEHITVKSRGLRELVIDSHVFRDHQILKISGPHLLKLRLLGFHYMEGEFKVDKLSSLVEVELNFEEAQPRGDLINTLLQSMHHVTKLVIGSYCLQVLSLREATGVFYPYLECQHLMFHVAADYTEAPGIAKILESSPHLEKLFLQMTCRFTSWLFVGEIVGRYNFNAEEFWNSVKERIYPCLTHLKNVEIVDPGADWVMWEPVLSLLKFLLQNAPLLDKIEINSNNSIKSDAVDSWVLLEVVRTILSHPNRSPNLKVILSYPSQGCPCTSVLKF